jgi:hypothetical protein
MNLKRKKRVEEKKKKIRACLDKKNKELRDQENLKFKTRHRQKPITKKDVMAENIIQEEKVNFVVNKEMVERNLNALEEMEKSLLEINGGDENGTDR